MNQCTLIGHLGKDPEVRTVNGTKVANFTLATTERYTDKEGERQSKTEWHNIVIWRKLAEVAEKYLHKGSQVMIQGKIETRKWDDRDGVTRYTTEIICSQMEMLGGKPEAKPTPEDYKEPSTERPEPQIDDLPF